mmetsp:Transcript_52486/g.109506  ORF Transcript_52486/g.109506 Transcript_52486/m.109506 type:complete len:131 (-) Transcript_52486:200-592(-)
MNSAAPAAKRARGEGAHGPATDENIDPDRGVDLKRRHEGFMTATAEKSLYEKCSTEGQGLAGALPSIKEQLPSLPDFARGERLDSLAGLCSTSSTGGHISCKSVQRPKTAGKPYAPYAPRATSRAARAAV